MAYKAGLEQWNMAVQAFEVEDFDNSLAVFNDMGGGSKIQFNIGIIYHLQQNYDLAIASYTLAVQLDQYFAIGYFQRGVANLQTEEYESAFEDFNDALLYLRGNSYIDYFQLGLEFRLQSCEVLYNRALCFFKLGLDADGMNDLLSASKEKTYPRKDLIQEAIDRKGRGCPAFSLPKNTIFKPCESMVKNAKKIDYLGSSKLIATNNKNSNDQIQRRKTAKNIKTHDSIMMDSSIILPVNLNKSIFSSESNNEPTTPNSEYFNFKPKMNRSMSISQIPKNKMKIKLYYNNNCQSILVDLKISFNELLELIENKLNLDQIKLKYLDEDDELVLITDQEDWEMALLSKSPLSDGSVPYFDESSGFDGKFDLHVHV